MENRVSSMVSFVKEKVAAEWTSDYVLTAKLVMVEKGRKDTLQRREWRSSSEDLAEVFECGT